jgi:hypothetical protein
MRKYNDVPQRQHRIDELGQSAFRQFAQRISHDDTLSFCRRRQPGFAARASPRKVKIAVKIRENRDRALDEPLVSSPRQPNTLSARVDSVRIRMVN